MAGKISDLSSAISLNTGDQIELLQSSVNKRLDLLTILNNLFAALASPTFTGTPLAPTAAQATNTTQIATTQFVTTAIAAGITGTLKFQNAVDCSANPNYPAASKGDVYVVSVAGKIGGASGQSVDIGDEFFATANNAGGTQASVGASWAILEHNIPSLGTLSTQNGVFTGNGTLATGGFTLTITNTASLSGTNTGDQTITLSGDASGSGTGAITITLAVVPTAKGGTNLNSYTTGDSLYASATNVLSKLAIGAAGKVKTSIGGIPTWKDPAGDLVTATDGSTVTFDLSASRRQIVVLGGNRTLALSNDADGMSFTLIVGQDGTGSRVPTLWSGIRWAGGTAPTFTTTPGKYDVLAFLRISSGVYLGFTPSQNH